MSSGAPWKDAMLKSAAPPWSAGRRSGPAHSATQPAPVATSPDSRSRRPARMALYAARKLAIAGAVMAAVVLLGWVTGIELLTAFRHGHTSMKPNAAVASLVLALGIHAVSRRPDHGSRRHGIVLASGLFAALIGTFTLLEYALGVDLRLDVLLANEAPGAVGTSSPGRMAVQTSTILVLLGTSLPAIAARSRTPVVAGQLAAAAALLISAGGALGYAFGEPALYRLEGATSTALPSAISLSVLSLAALCASADRGWVATLSSELVGGAASRRLLLPSLLLPVALGLALLEGNRAGLFSPAFAMASFAMGIAAAFTAMLWSSARALNAADRGRRAAELEADATRALLEQRVRERTADLRIWEQIFHNASWGVAVTDPDTGELLAANPAFAEMHGATLNQVLGRPIGELISPESRKTRPETPAVIQQGGRASYETIHVRRDGSLFPVLTEVTLVRDDEGRVKYRAANLQDITDRKEAEEAVRRLNRELEWRVRDRTAQLEAVNRELESFAYSVSHDLRAPLRAIDGFSQALLEDYGPVLEEQGGDYLRRTRAAAQRMAQLIDELLALSRVTRAALAREPVDLSRIATKVIEELRSAWPEREVEVDVEPGVIVQGDPTLLGSVMQNLLGNAWKFTSRTAGAKVQFGTTMARGVRACFVSDNGAGFDMRYAAKLFGAFQRLHSVADFEGNGIGLATVQRIVHRHGGWIEARGEVGRGATFTFWIASASAARTAAQERSHA